MNKMYSLGRRQWTIRSDGNTCTIYIFIRGINANKT